MLAGKPHDTQYRLRRHDGVYRWFINKAIPVRDADGHDHLVDRHRDRHRRAQTRGRCAARRRRGELGVRGHARCVGRAAAAGRRRCGAPRGLVRRSSVLDAAGRLKPVAIAHRDPNKRPIRARVTCAGIRGSGRRPAVAGRGRPGFRCASTPITTRCTTRSKTPSSATWRSRSACARSSTFRSAIRRRYGVFSWRLAESDRHFTDDDQQLATLIAQRASIAVVERAALRAPARGRAHAAVRLPPAGAAAVSTAVAFDATYAAGTRDLTIGGDWYDAFARDDGTIAFSVGDVAGRGLEAAVPMGKMRQTFRALGVVESDPARGSRSPTPCCGANTPTCSSPRSSRRTTRARTC